MELNIKTYYFDRKGNALRTNSASDANLAVASAVRHMQVNHYGATVCQVVEMPGAILHAEVKRSVRGSLAITYERDPREYETRIVLELWQQELDSK